MRNGFSYTQNSLKFVKFLQSKITEFHLNFFLKKKRETTDKWENVKVGHNERVDHRIKMKKKKFRQHPPNLIRRPTCQSVGVCQRALLSLLRQLSTWEARNFLFFLSLSFWPCADDERHGPPPSLTWPAAFNSRGTKIPVNKVSRVHRPCENGANLKFLDS